MIRKIQSGRSMLEMLGVLAIMAVMTIGGITLYSMADEDNKVNRFLDFAALSTNKVSGFYRTYASSAKTVTAGTLCNFELLPDDICKATTGTATTRYGYFKETLTPSVAIDKSDETGTGTLSVKRPYILYNIAVSGLSSKSACVSIVTDNVWKKTGDLAYVTGVGDLSATQLPLSVTDANKCDDTFTITVVIDHNKS